MMISFCMERVFGLVFCRKGASMGPKNHSEVKLFVFQKFFGPALAQKFFKKKVSPDFSDFFHAIFIRNLRKFKE